MWLRQSTTVTVRLGPFLDKVDAVTEKTAITPVVEVSRNHAAFGARSSGSAVSHDSNGWYAVPLDATDTGTLGPLVLKSDDSTTYLPVWREFLVVPASVYDAMVSGTDWLPVDSFKPTWNVAATTLTVKKPDNTTTAYTKTVTSDASAAPVTGAT